MPEDVKVRITGDNQSASAFREAQASMEQLKGAAEALGVALSLNEIVEGIDRVNELGGSLVRLSATSGLTVEQLSALRFAAQQNGQDFGALQNALNAFARNALNAAETGTGKAAQAFKALGINVLDSNGKIKPTGELLEEVAKKLAALPPGLERSGTAAQLLTRQGAAMLPTLMSLAGGFDQLEHDAASAGALIGGETAEQLEEAEKATKRLEAGVEGLGVQFVAALDPSLEKTINALGQVQGQMSAAQLAGKDLGAVVEWLAEQFTGFTHGVSAEIFSVSEAFENMGADVMEFFSKHDFTPELRKRDADLAQQYRDLAASYHAQTQSIIQDFGKVHDALNAPSGDGGQQGKKPGLGDGDGTDLAGMFQKKKDKTKELEDALIALRKAGIDAQVTVAKAGEKEQIALLDLEKEQGLLTFDDYYKRRLAMQKAAAQAEVDAAKAKLTDALSRADTATDSVDRTKATEDATKAAAELQAKESELHTVILQGQTEELKKAQELRDFQIATEAELRAEKGQTLQAALNAIQREYDEKRKKAAELGAGPDVMSSLDDAERLKMQRTQAEDLKSQIEEIYDELDMRIEEEKTKVANFAETDIEAQKKINAMKEEYAKKLQALIDLYKQLAQVSGDPKMMAQVDQMQTKHDGLTQKTQQLKQAVAGTLTDGFDSFFSTLQRSGSAAQAFKAMANSIIADIERMVEKMLVQMMIQKMLGMLFPSAGGAGGGSSAGFGSGSVPDLGGMDMGDTDDSVPFFAGGGSLSANQPAIVGEAGPELWVPSTAGQVLPNSVFGGSGGRAPNMQVTMVNNGTPKNIQATQPQWNEQMKQWHLQLHMDDMVSNGPLSRSMASGGN